eukprot:COSAG01_NODE_42203_length_442_cov_1.338192_1_plen_99_part_10
MPAGIFQGLPEQRANTVARVILGTQGVLARVAPSVSRVVIQQQRETLLLPQNAHLAQPMQVPDPMVQPRSVCAHAIPATWSTSLPVWWEISHHAHRVHL